MDTLPQGQSSKSPAFSFYAKDWLAATLTWALDARGAYATLLAYQWDAGSVPGDDAKALARVLGVSTLKARAVWSVVSHKFNRRDDGTWTNARLEDERRKQADRRAALRDNGLKGGRPKNQQVNQTESNRFSGTEPDENLNKSLSSSSSLSSSEEQKNTHNAPARTNGQSRGANTPGSLPRDHRFHGHCSTHFRLCLSEPTSVKLMGLWGGAPDDSSPVVQEFIDALELQIGDGPKGDHLWLMQHFEAFMATKGRTPIPAPVKPKQTANGSVSAAIDKWGTE